MPSRYEALLAQLRAEVPGFRVVPKASSRRHRVLDRALRIVTLGRMTAYMDYQTTLGRTVYVTPDFARRSDDDKYITLVHEAVHVRQFVRFTPVGMALLYLLAPLPIGLAWCRAAFEKEAYAAEARAIAEVYGVARARAERADVVAQFVGPAYAWMWPFRAAIERWYDQVLASLEDSR